MDASAFWEVIGNYNKDTMVFQIVLLTVLIISVLVTYRTKLKWLLKAVLSFINLFIGVGFFLTYGTQPIQRFFAFPLYLLIGTFFAMEAVRNKDDEIGKPDIFAAILMALYVLYPLVSILLGSSFPKMVTHIMPCPVVTISLALYSCYKKKNRLLILWLTIWGLTGVKSVIFNAYEDIILLLSGFYGVYLLLRKKKFSV